MRFPTAVRWFVTIQLIAAAWAVVFGLPYEFGGIGLPGRVFQDAWTHGTGLSAPIPFLALIVLLGFASRRPGRGGTAATIALLALLALSLVAGLFEPAWRRALLGEIPRTAATGVLVLTLTGLMAVSSALVDEWRRLRAKWRT